MGRRSPQKPVAAAPLAMRRPRVAGRDWLVAAGLVLLVFTVFGQVAGHKFLNYDDGQSIYENAHVSQGLTGSSIEWALTSAETGWYPLTWLSHELDVTVWGVRPGPHLLMNVAFHALNAVLLFLALTVLFRREVEGSREPQGQTISHPNNQPIAHPGSAAAFIAVLFALHPMHVESVAWISERKDTLSTLFILVALLLYARAPHRRLGVALAMAASLAAKQMYVTFPFVLLLLDHWPLGRLRTWSDLNARIVEKAPLFAMSVAGSAIAVVGQKNLKAVQTSLPFAGRLANAAVAYSRYLGKLFVPTDLAVPYPLVALTESQELSAALFLLAVTAAALLLLRRAPYVAVGWFWFLGTLVPVIGIVALGAQSMADRYSYFSYIGLFIAITFGAMSLPLPRKALAAAGILVIVAYGVLAWNQTGYWQDSERLFTHAIASTPPNAAAEYSLGQTLELTKPDASIDHLRRAVAFTRQAALDSRSAPPAWCAQAQVGLGTALLMKARNESSVPARVVLVHEAQKQFLDALAIDPSAPHAKNNLAFAQAMLGQVAAGVSQRSEYDAAIDRGVALLSRGDGSGAVAAFKQSIDLQPRSAAAHAYLALALLRMHRAREAAEALRTANAIDPKQTNDLVTKAMRMPPGPDNVDIVITQLLAGGS
jgi:protein O-mannosyl-transferase